MTTSTCALECRRDERRNRLHPVQPKPEAPKPAEPDLPSLEDCAAAISAGENTGVSAIAERAASLKTVCPELAAILQSSAVKTSLETYARQDAEAIRQQTELMREANLANFCLLAAGVTSGAILAVAALSSASASATDYLTLALGVLTFALGAGAAYFGYVARDQGRIARWQASRGDAEMARLAVFTTMAAKAGEASPKVALYGLAVVLRDLLDDQRNYLSKRALRHRKSSEATSRWGGFASALAFIGGSGAIIASQLKGAVWIVLAGVVGAAIGAFSTNRDALLRDRANADRYEKTRVALDGIAARTDDDRRQDRRRRAEGLVGLYRNHRRSAWRRAQAMAGGNRPGRSFPRQARRAAAATRQGQDGRRVLGSKSTAGWKASAA